MRHRTAVPHSSYHLLCMLEWSLGGHSCVCINHSTQNFKGCLKKTRIEDISNFINICRTNPIKVLKLGGFILCRSWVCPSNNILKINQTNCCWYCDPLSKTGSLCEQSKHKLNPMQTIKLVNHIQSQISRLRPKCF